MSEVLEGNIRTAIIRSVTNVALPHSNHVLDNFMMNAATRDLCYLTAVKISVENDSVRRNAIAELLCSYVAGFPPSDLVLEKLIDMCVKLGSTFAVAVAFEDLKQVATIVLSQLSVQSMMQRLSDVPTSDFRSADTSNSLVPHYVSKMSLVPSCTADADRRRNIVITQWNTRECTAVALEKNQFVREGGLRLYYSLATCKDYLWQIPLQCSHDVLDAQISLLGTYFENYKNCVAVTRSTSFLVKVLCDSYVTKIPLRSNFIFFREVSVAFLPFLLKMMESEYFCVRNHVYDILLTVGMHMQLVDTTDAVPGLGEALQNELCWMIAHVIRRQALVTDAADERIWLSATKCIVAVMPAKKIRLLDGRAFRIIMSQQLVAYSHPHIFHVFAEALAGKLLPDLFGVDGTEFDNGGSPPQPQGAGSPSATPLTNWVPLDEDIFSEQFGHAGVNDIIALYLNAVTASARYHLFRIIFSIAVSTIQKKAPGQGMPRVPIHAQDRRAHLSRCLKLLVDIEFHWYLRSIVSYQPHTSLKELPQQVTLDMDMRETRDIKSLLVAILQQITNLIDNFHKMPDAIQRTISVAASTPGDPNGPRELVALLPNFAKDDTDGTLRRLVVRATFHCLRVFRSPSDDGEDVVAALIRSIALSPVPRVRSICPDVVMALTLLSRTQPQQAVVPLHHLLKAFLSKESSPPHLLALYYAVLETLVVQHGLSLHDGDITSFCVSGQFQVQHSAVEALSAPILWSLYWSLRSVQLAAAQRARYVLVSILCNMDLPGGSTYQITLWTKVMGDSYPPCAVAGAQKIIRISGLSAYDKYEAAISEAQRAENPTKLSSSYTMATNIWHRVEAEMKQRVQPA